MPVFVFFKICTWRDITRQHFWKFECVCCHFLKNRWVRFQSGSHGWPHCVDFSICTLAPKSQRSRCSLYWIRSPRSCCKASLLFQEKGLGSDLSLPGALRAGETGKARNAGWAERRWGGGFVGPSDVLLRGSALGTAHAQGRGRSASRRGLQWKIPQNGNSGGFPRDGG